MYKIDKIIKKIEKYKYISFDIFDTLIKRNVEKPSDIFSAVNIEYEKKYGNNLSRIIKGQLWLTNQTDI